MLQPEEQPSLIANLDSQLDSDLEPDSSELDFEIEIMAESEAQPPQDVQTAPAQPDAAAGKKKEEAAAVKPVPASAPSVGKATSNLPAVGKTTLGKIDELIVRLSKLIKTSAGLNAGLGYVNYGIFVLAYLHAVSGEWRIKLITTLQRVLGREPKVLTSLEPTTTFLTPLGALLSDTRTSLRLTGLIPLYVLLKSLLDTKSPKRADPVSHRIALVQCLAYIAFQLTENIWHLSRKDVIPASFIENRGGAAKWLQWSCRAWVVGILSDFLRLGREAQLNQQLRDQGKVTVQEQENFEAAWWTSLQTDAAWLPMALHYSIEGGLSWMNPGLVALSGFLAYRGNFKNAWAATKV
ncbi:hypothetical protein DV736_g6432, partial [Chaetothyriales sp. CBS 134916]